MKDNIDTSKKIKMVVSMDVTSPQALTLRAMFAYWNYLAGIGASRFVSFYVDGDGNFHPNCDVAQTEFPDMTDEEWEHIKELAVIEDNDGHRKYDFDSIGWMLHSD